MDLSAERKCVHELANNFTVIQGAVKKVLKTVEEKGIALPPEEKDRLLKADDYLKRSIETLRALRTGLVEKSEQGS